MWGGKILDYYADKNPKIRDSGERYFAFLEKMQKIAKGLLKLIGKVSFKERLILLSRTKFKGVSMSMVAGEVKKFALKKGASLVGIADAEHMKEAPEGHKPTDIVGDAKTIVVIATPQAKAILSDSPPTEYTRSTFSCEAKLEIIAHDIANFLDESSYKAVPVPVRMSLMMDNKALMGDLSHKHAAVFAGLGQMGKNSLLITPKYGNRCYISSIVTDAPLHADKPFKKDLCGDCVLCINACPVKAISRSNEGSYIGKKYVDKHRCYAYSKTQRDEYLSTQGLYTCRECRTSCPYSK